MSKLCLHRKLTSEPLVTLAIHVLDLVIEITPTVPVPSAIWNLN